MAFCRYSPSDKAVFFFIFFFFFFFFFFFVLFLKNNFLPSGVLVPFKSRHLFRGGKYASEQM